jgi:hypothetical protein
MKQVVIALLVLLTFVKRGELVKSLHHQQSIRGGLDRFEGRLVDQQGNDVPLSRISNKKFIGLYYSAHWSPPDRQFTPLLASIYKGI